MFTHPSAFLHSVLRIVPKKNLQIDITLFILKQEISVAM
jgi:hypothetical protein